MNPQTGRLVLASLLVGLATLGVMLATEPRLAIVWDEGYTLGREARLRAWFSALHDPPGFAARWAPPALELVQQVGAPPPRPEQIDSRSKLLFDPKVLAYFWPFAREEPHGHPPFYALLGLLGDLLAPSWQDLPRARLGPIVLFSLTAAILFGFAAGRWGPWPAAASASAWVLQPNLFGHGHYAAYDGVLSALWVLAIIAFDAALGPPAKDEPAAIRKLPTLAFGLVVGCALATKLTGWFLLLPFLAWTAWRRDSLALRVLLIGLPLACLVLFLLNPPWWTEPTTGLLRFLRSNLTRGQTIPIPVQFLGTVYQTPNESLPWYNTLVWTALVTPVGFLVLAASGLLRAVIRRRKEPLSLLIALHWLLLIALRALPHTPGHDGVRLFLPAFGVLAMLAGLGARQWIDQFGRLARGGIAAALIEGAVSLALLMPVPLSYFSPLVGGLPGAVRLGMEPTYYWDGLTTEARSWLRTHTDTGQTVRFATFPTSWLYLQRTGELPPGLWPLDPRPPAWYVLQNRPGAWLPSDRQIVAMLEPAFTVRKQGVPLVLVYSFADVEPHVTTRVRSSK
jgi:4-amino-4-deoxy-L-arabinose transferase-like glycosyltransferase